MDSASQSTPTGTGSGRRYLTTKQAAEYVGLSHRTLEAYRFAGAGPSYIKHGGPRSGLVLYLPEDLDAWLVSLRRRNTSDRGTQCPTSQ